MAFRLNKQSNNIGISNSSYIPPNLNYNLAGLPNGVTFGNYAYYDGSNWILGGTNSVLLGQQSGIVNQGANSVAIGTDAGSNNQLPQSVAIGYGAGRDSQGENCVAIGPGSALSNQKDNSIAIGNSCGYNQNTESIAIGTSSGGNQGQNCVAIGTNAGFNAQGDNSIAIGYNAGTDSQEQNSICINATGNTYGVTQPGFYVTPVRSAPLGGGEYVLSYIDNEIIENTGKTFVINHPNNNNKYLIHSCLEGPEVGVYYRGQSEIFDEITKMVTVYLPDYTKNFIYDFTINITPIFNGKNVNTFNVSNINTENNSFSVYGTDIGKFYWTVFGKRCELNVEPNKCDVNVKGYGPYLYI